MSSRCWVEDRTGQRLCHYMFRSAGELRQVTLKSACNKQASKRGRGEQRSAEKADHRLHKRGKQEVRGNRLRTKDKRALHYKCCKTLRHLRSYSRESMVL